MALPSGSRARKGLRVQIPLATLQPQRKQIRIGKHCLIAALRICHSQIESHDEKLAIGSLGPAVRNAFPRPCQSLLIHLPMGGDPV